MFKMNELVCPCCSDNKNLDIHVTFAPGLNVGEILNPRLKIFCGECKELLFIPLSFNHPDDLRKSTLFTEILPIGIAVKITEKTTLLGIKKEPSAATESPLLDLIN